MVGHDSTGRVGGTVSKAFVPQAEGLVFKSQPRQTQVIKTGSYSSTVKRSALGVSFTGPPRWLL